MTRKTKNEEPKQLVPTDWLFVEKILDSPLLRTVYMHGTPGLGKTYAAYRMGRVNNGVYAITLTEDTPASELRGHYLPKGSEFVWRDGPFTQAMREGARLVINEVSHAAPEAMTFLHPVLESIETAQLTLPNNETVRPAPGFHVIATDNQPPEQLPPALRDRFDSTIEITEPHPNVYERLGDDLANAARRSFLLEEERYISPRGWLAVQRLRGDFGLEEACRAVFGRERGGQVHEALKMAEA